MLTQHIILLTDPKILVQTGMYNTQVTIPGNVLQQRTDELKRRKTVVTFSSRKWYDTFALDTLKS